MTEPAILNKIGLIFSIISFIVVIVVAYFTPNILAFFDVQKLISDNIYVNSVIRIYAGFLVSTLVSMIAQVLLYLFNIWLFISDEEYLYAMDGIKPVRNVSGYTVGALYLLLFLIAGLEVVKV